MKQWQILASLAVFGLIACECSRPGPADEAVRNSEPSVVSSSVPEPPVAPPSTLEPKDESLPLEGGVLTAEEKVKAAKCIANFQEAWDTQNIEKLAAFFSEHLTGSLGTEKQAAVALCQTVISEKRIDTRCATFERVGVRVRVASITAGEGADDLDSLSLSLEEENGSLKIVEFIISPALTDAEEFPTGKEPFQSPY